MNESEEIEIEVFRAGSYAEKGNYDEQKLEQIAGDYTPSLHEAPVTFDHQQSGPAHGWVKEVKRIGDRLVARLGQLSPALREALQNRSFKKRSIELYRQFGETGRPYLKSISFLGAAAPAVKGLPDPIFTEDEEETISFEENGETVSFYEKAREELIAAQAWNPAWEEMGFRELTESFSSEATLECLLAILKSGNPKVSLEAAPMQAKPGSTRFSEELVGVETCASEPIHRAAGELMNRDEKVSYRDALLSLKTTRNL